MGITITKAHLLILSTRSIYLMRDTAGSFTPQLLCERYFVILRSSNSM
jgi:hypothetical protein